MGLSVMADSTLWKPVITDPALLASDRPWRRSSRSDGFDVRGEGLGSLGLGLEGAGEEATFDRLLHHVGTGRDPDAAARQLVPEIGHDLVVGPEDEADQSRGGSEPRG